MACYFEIKRWLIFCDTFDEDWFLRKKRNRNLIITYHILSLLYCAQVNFRTKRNTILCNTLKTVASLQTLSTYSKLPCKFDIIIICVFFIIFYFVAPILDIFCVGYPQAVPFLLKYGNILMSKMVKNTHFWWGMELHSALNACFGTFLCPILLPPNACLGSLKLAMTMTSS